VPTYRSNDCQIERCMRRRRQEGDVLATEGQGTGEHSYLHSDSKPWLKSFDKMRTQASGNSTWKEPPTRGVGRRTVDTVAVT
jgi:hypothetical protein